MRALHLLTALLLLVGMSLTGCDTDGIDTECFSGHPTCGDDGDGGNGDDNDDGGGHGEGDDDDGEGDGEGDDDGEGDGETQYILASIDATATYLRAETDAPYAYGFPLDELGLTAGEPACFLAQGDVALGDGTTASERGFPLAVAVFSSTPRLDTTDVLDRVEGALDAGDDVETPLTVPNDLETDIDQDFDATDTCVTVPDGAEYIYFSAFDGYFADNEGLDDYGVRVAKK